MTELCKRKYQGIIDTTEDYHREKNDTSRMCKTECISPKSKTNSHLSVSWESIQFNYVVLFSLILTTLPTFSTNLEVSETILLFILENTKFQL